MGYVIGGIEIFDFGLDLLVPKQSVRVYKRVKKKPLILLNQLQQHR